MKNKNRIWLISFGCIGIGIVLLIAGMMLGGRPGFYIDRTGIHSQYSNSSDSPYIQEKMRLDEFSSIDIDLNYADIKIQPSDGYYLEYQLDGAGPEPEYEVKNGKLRFKESPAGGFIGGLNFFTFSDFSRSYDYYVILYVPADKYFKAVKLVSDDGMISTGDIRAESMDITDDYGQVSIESFKGRELSINMDDGRLKIQNLDADTVLINNEYGECEIENMKVKTLEARLDDGDFKVSKGHAANLDIDNEYGNVTLGMSEKLDAYDLDLETEYGRIEVQGYPEMSNSDDEARFKSNNGAEHKAKVRCDDGDIVIAQAR
ncbi:DUF4097 domain-containing protein [Ruminococcus sp. OA3]|uniref:DUF4097 family beta strand repeat-containing protein n=1 Tax=Ruminococcus sp. OA3 TaxID=2914164 RepID=UPI001F06FE9B|nr:DUF4097 family beta strand repeat-containing protein [Ruminococcus sp. OA3]MCH1983364.1 DUF4097 domain-containing protein [Ruminococcus sp. OA3]